MQLDPPLEESSLLGPGVVRSLSRQTMYTRAHLDAHLILLAQRLQVLLVRQHGAGPLRVVGWPYEVLLRELLEHELLLRNLPGRRLAQCDRLSVTGGYETLARLRHGAYAG